jgi:hypothetical protein
MLEGVLGVAVKSFVLLGIVSHLGKRESSSFPGIMFTV